LQMAIEEPSALQATGKAGAKIVRAGMENA
jgi:hypothetical protein